jgi:hypothetical protein
MTSLDSGAVPFVQKVSIAQTPAFILPRVRGGGKRWGLEQLERFELFEPCLLRVVVLAPTMNNSKLCREIKVRESQSRHSMMSGNIVNNGSLGPTARPGNNNPAPDFTGSTAQCVRIELEQVTQRFAVSGAQLL